MKTMYALLIPIMGISLLMYFAGLLEHCEADPVHPEIKVCTSETPTSTILNILLNPQDFGNSNFSWANIWILALQGAVATGIVAASLLFGSRVDVAVRATVAVFLSLFIWDVLHLFNILAQVSFFLAIILCSPIMFLYGIIVIDWFSAY